VTLDEIDRRTDGAAAVDAIDGVDLHEGMSAIRHQGDRPTCVAHAVCSVAEYLERNGGAAESDLSEQYLYWTSKHHDGEPQSGGTMVKVAMERMVEEGTCAEAVWPYVPQKVPGNEPQDPAPPSADEDAAAHQFADSDDLGTGSAAALCSALDERRPVALAVPVFPNWTGNQMFKLSGFIPMPLPGGPPDDGHAMCAVGYGHDEDFAGGGYFILRNSWGTQFAPSSPVAPGHALLPFAYWEEYGWEAFVGAR
jgi:C1A family cysteine protease